MFGPENSYKMIQDGNQVQINTQDKAQNKQALQNPPIDLSLIKVKFGNQIIFTFPQGDIKGVQIFSWPWQEESILKNNQNLEVFSTTVHSFLSQQNIEQNCRPDQKKKIIVSQTSEDKHKQLQTLYSQGISYFSTDQVGVLKKNLEFQFKGLLSKSTDNDSTLGIPVLYRFKCKNSNSSNPCPFLHILEYCRQQNGKTLYRHRSFCSSHTPQCTLDDENVQYNVIMRKIDSSMHILEQIIRKDSQIKPKQILEVLAKQINQVDQNFLYEGLNTKNIRRSIKKYFDNAIAKVKAKLRQK